MSKKQQVGSRRSAVFLARTPVFTLQDFASAIGTDTTTALSRVKYYVSQERIKSLERGLYATVPLGTAAATVHPDTFMVATTVRPDAVFAYHSALELLGVAYSAWSTVTVYTGRPRRPLSLENTTIEFLSHPTALVRSRQTDLGTRQVEPLGRRLTVTGRERTLVDGFHRLARVGGLDEFLESVGAFGTLDFELLERILKTYNQKILWAVVGWFCERQHNTLFTPETFLRSCERHRPTSPVYIPRDARGGTLVARWNVVLPNHLVEMDTSHVA